MRAILEPCCIFSAHKAELSEEENAVRTECAKGLLNFSQIPYRQVDGVYEGRAEKSFVVHDRFRKELEGEIFGRFKQDSILLLDCDRKAFLLCADNSRIPLGKWRAVSEEYAKGRSCYTHDWENDTFYVAE